MPFPLLGFNSDEVTDPQFIAALQQFANAFAFIDVPFNALDISGNGGPVFMRDHTLNVSAYRVIGGVMEWTFTCILINVGAAVASLTLKLPTGYRAAQHEKGGVTSTLGWGYDNGNGIPILIQAQNGDDKITVLRSDLAAWANTGGAYVSQIRGQIRLKVSPPT